MKLILALTIAMMSSFAVAQTEIRKGQIGVLFDNNDFGSILIQGDAAALIFEKMKVEEKDHRGFNSLGAFSYKTSLDGKLSCEKYRTSNRVECRQFFNPSTGNAEKFQNGYPY